MRFKAKVSIEIDIEENNDKITVEDAEKSLGCKFGSVEHEEYIREMIETILKCELSGSVKSVSVGIKDFLAYDEKP